MAFRPVLQVHLKPVHLGEVFRTDAKAEGDLVVVSFVGGVWMKRGRRRWRETAYFAHPAGSRKRILGWCRRSSD